MLCYITHVTLELGLYNIMLCYISHDMLCYITHVMWGYITHYMLC